jgi:DNA-binding NtrC family response regulator
VSAAASQRSLLRARERIVHELAASLSIRVAESARRELYEFGGYRFARARARPAEMGPGRAVNRVLVVSHDAAVGAALVYMLQSLGLQNVLEAHGAECALHEIAGGIDAAFVSAAMPDQLALRLTLSSTRTCPSPAIVAVSDGAHPDLFALARAGARAHLLWPASSQDVARCLDATSWSASELDAELRALVGRLGMREAQARLRRAMLEQALESSNGSRRAAARLLGVTRPAIQRMLRDDLACSPARASEPTKARLA